MPSRNVGAAAGADEELGADDGAGRLGRGEAGDAADEDDAVAARDFPLPLFPAAGPTLDAAAVHGASVLRGACDGSGAASLAACAGGASSRTMWPNFSSLNGLAMQMVAPSECALE